MRHQVVQITGLALVVLLEQSGSAQGRPTAVSTEGSAAAAPGYGDIVVTAQRREQALQDVPIAVSAIPGSYLQDRQIQSIEKLSALAPNLQVTKNPTSATATVVTMRGSGTQNAGILFDPAVGLYLDGVYVGKAAGSIFDVSDLERVEALRGPQGTLYGRNTLAGAINIVTRKPSDQFRAEADISYGNYSYYAVRGLLNVPLTDTLFVKVSGQVRLRDGFTRLVPDPQGIYLENSKTGTLDTLNRRSVIAQVRWLPVGEVSVDYSFDWSRISESTLNGLFAVTPGGILDSPLPALAGFRMSPYIPANPTNRPKTISNNNRSHQLTKVQGHALTINVPVGDTTLRSITGYRKFTDNNFAPDKDTDGTPIYNLADPRANFGMVMGGAITHYDQFSQELQAQGTLLDDQLNFTLGAYYFKDDADTINPQAYFLGASQYYTRYGGQTRSYAFYGQAEYQLTDELTLTGGLRYTWERKRVERVYRTIAGTPAVPDFEITRADDVHKKFKRVTPAVILAYEPTDTVNLYASYSQGYRSGGFNGEATTAAVVSTPYKPEINDAFELGAKTQLFDRRLQLNVAGFYQKQKDKQLSVFSASGTASSFIQNAGRARVKGFEIEAVATPFEVLTVQASYGYTSQKYTRFIDVDRTDPANPGPVDVKDYRTFSRAPKHTFNAGANLRLYEGTGSIYLAGDVSHTSFYYSLVGTRRVVPGSTGAPDPRFPLIVEASSVHIPAVTTVDARIRWSDIPAGPAALSAVFFVNNLTNQRKVVNKINFGPNFGGLTNANYMDPRTYGITLSARY